MNRYQTVHPPSRFALAALAVAFAAMAALPSVSRAAGTAAGTKITNIAHVNYNNSAGIAQSQVNSNAVDVTITLVPSGVNISPSITTNTVNEGTATTVTYTVYGTANGLDTYTFASSETPGSGTISTVSGTITPFAPATLAGTSLAVAANAGDTSITVPLDSTGATGVNVGTVLRIGANTYTVATITPNAGTNTTVITFVGGVPLAVGTALPAGAAIGEQKTFTVSFPSGVLTGAVTNTQTANATIASATLPAATATSANTVITVNVLPASLLISKAACTTSPVIGAAACFGVAGNAAPGGTILYKVVVTNNGTGVAKAVVIDDKIQRFLTYTAGSAKYAVGAIGTQNTKSYNDVTLNALTEGAGGYSYNAGTTTINYAYPVDLANGNELVLFYAATVVN